MRDLIDRAEAIDVIDAIFPVDPTKSEYAQGIACGAALAKTYIEQLPSAQPTQTNTPNALESLDCISRQAAIDAFYNATADGDKAIWCACVLCKVPSAQPEFCEYWDAESNYCALNRPSAQPEIIRCRDCSHFHEYEWYCDAWNNSPGFPKVTEDGFCDLAERRTDEAD